MKITESVKEVNVGQVVELSNVELSLLKKEVDAIIESSPQLVKHLEKNEMVSDLGYTNVKAKNLVNIVRLVNKITKNVPDTNKIYNELFSSGDIPLTEESVNELIEASTFGNKMSDKESV